eukprot:1064750-Amphidinium_carterae.1
MVCYGGKVRHGVVAENSVALPHGVCADAICAQGLRLLDSLQVASSSEVRLCTEAHIGLLAARLPDISRGLCKVCSLSVSITDVATSNRLGAERGKSGTPASAGNTSVMAATPSRLLPAEALHNQAPSEMNFKVRVSCELPSLHPLSSSSKCRRGRGRARAVTWTTWEIARRRAV